MGAVSKTFYASQMGIDPANLVMISVMPCIAKKYEATLPINSSSKLRDVENVLTTRELAKMFKEAGVDLRNMPNEDFDDPLGKSTGAGVTSGATGGVLKGCRAYDI